MFFAIELLIFSFRLRKYFRQVESVALELNCSVLRWWFQELIRYLGLSLERDLLCFIELQGLTFFEREPLELAMPIHVVNLPIADKRFYQA